MRWAEKLCRSAECINRKYGTSSCAAAEKTTSTGMVRKMQLSITISITRVFNSLQALAIRTPCSHSVVFTGRSYQATIITAGGIVDQSRVANKLSYAVSLKCPDS